MPSKLTTFIPSCGADPGSGLTRLRLADEIYTARQTADPGAGLGFIITQRSELTPLPKPRGPRRPAPGRIG